MINRTLLSSAAALAMLLTAVPAKAEVSLMYAEWLASRVEPGIANFEKETGEKVNPTPETMTPLHRLEWEHIQQALNDTGGNVSATARLLGMHRRSLQRKLAKRPGPERTPRED